MQRVGKFAKVSLEEFYKAMSDGFGAFYDWCLDKEYVRQVYDQIQLPSRATVGSAGYDFRSPFDFDLGPHDTVRLPTGIRVFMEDGWWLGCLPRSGLGVKYRVRLDNTMGVIDSDYCHADNEGHIFAQITRDGGALGPLSIKSGDRFMQTIFIPFGITYDDKVCDQRHGGLGSTGQ